MGICRVCSKRSVPLMGKQAQLPILSKRMEEILQAAHFYRYMTALDGAHLFFSPKAITHVRAVLNLLAGGYDFQTNNYLYRFRLPAQGNAERVYTLGSRGRDFLLSELGMPAGWYFRPQKVKHLSYSHMAHSLILTRFLVAAQSWVKTHPDFRILQKRISYEISQHPVHVNVTYGGHRETIKVIPDAWLLFERTGGEMFPILLEIDRGTEYQQKFKQHIRARIEFIRSGAYREMFGTQAVMIVYATTGDIPEYRETRRTAMCNWTREVLIEQKREKWASIFRFGSLVLDEMYAMPLFEKPVWYQPDVAESVALLKK